MRKSTLASWLLLAAFLFPTSAHADWKKINLLTDTTVTDAAANQSGAIGNDRYTRGYLVVTTANEVGVSSLGVSVNLMDGAEEERLCLLPGITTETTSILVFGLPGASASEQIDVVCEFPLPQSFSVNFTITGASTSFDITADLFLIE